MLNFIAIDLQLYKIFKITRVSFFGTSYTPVASSAGNDVSKMATNIIGLERRM